MKSSTATELEPHSSPPVDLKSASAVDLRSGGIYLNQPNYSSNGLPRKSDKEPEELELTERTADPSAASSALGATVGQEVDPATMVDPSLPSTKLRERIQFFSLCYAMFLLGWNDGTTGPLLPRIQEVYHVGFTVVSLIFIANCIGFVSGSLSNIQLTEKFGFGITLVIGSVVQLAGYCIMSAAPPFPLFVIAFTLTGFGMALQDAQANGYVASYKHNSNAKMGILHAVYGVGAFASPLVATQFSGMPRWSFHFLVSLGIALSNTALLITVFRFKTQDECMAQIGHPRAETGTSEDSKYRQILGLKTLHLLAFFVLVYVGVEVTIGGWIVTFIQQVRGGGHSSGYISSGFFGGLTVGRVALLWVNHKVGERLVLFIYIALAIALELVIWLVPSLIGGAVSVSLVGVLLGPVYPIVMNEASRILPRWLLTGCIGWIAGFGQTGSALLPFMTGAIAGKAGIWCLQPLLVGMMGLLFVLWALVPTGHQRAD